MGPEDAVPYQRGVEGGDYIEGIAIPRRGARVNPDPKTLIAEKMLLSRGAGSNWVRIDGIRGYRAAAAGRCVGEGVTAFGPAGQCRIEQSSGSGGSRGRGHAVGGAAAVAERGECWGEARAISGLIDNLRRIDGAYGGDCGSFIRS